VHDAQLSGREPDPDRIAHDRHHALRLAGELRPERANLGGAGLQDGVAELADVLKRGFASPKRLGGQLLRPLVSRGLRLDRLWLTDGSCVSAFPH
jgi:hypothetical protein